MVLEVFSRYGGIDIRENDSIKSAISCMKHDVDYGLAFGIGIYDAASNKVYIPTSEPAGITTSDYRLDDIRKACQLADAHIFESVERFDL